MPKRRNKKKTTRRGSPSESEKDEESQHGASSSSRVRSPEQKESGVPMVVHINYGNAQYGSNNVMVVKGQELSSIVSDDKSYADAVTGQTRNNIEKKLDTDFSHLERKTSVEETKSDSKQSNRSNIGAFLEKVHNFERGHFVLVTGEQSNLNGIDALAHINWTAVFDFDPHSRYKGLLSRLEPTISKLRSLHVGSIQDSFTDTFSEERTNWVFFKGCSDRPDTRLPDDFNDWNTMSNEFVEHKLRLLKQYASVFTYITFIALWPTNDVSVQCMQSVLSRICTIFKSSVVILVNDEKQSKLSDRKLEDAKDYTDVSILKLGILDMCTGCSSVLKMLESEDHCYSLPMTNGPIRIAEDKAQWLKEDLHVLYVNNTRRVKYSFEQLKQLEETFRKGGTLTWDWLYAGGAGHVDIERDIMPNIKRHLRSVHITKQKPGQVTILHEPGAGGTTLGRKLLWELREETPCVEIIQDSVTNITDQRDKLAFLSDITNAPIVALIDGDDEIRVKKLQKLASRDGICLIVIYLRRTTSNDCKTASTKDTVFNLEGKLSKSEAKMLELKCKNSNLDEKRRLNVRTLVDAVENDNPKTIFEFGLAAHSFEYTGIESYVLSHLKLNAENSESEIEKWQKALAYISLVYFYGHSSVPCHFFTDMLSDTGNKRKILQVDDFPQQMQELIVPGETPMYTARISHFYVAKEILEQVLLRMRPRVSQPLSPFLCNEARRLLGEFSTEFISDAVKRNHGNASDVLNRIMIDTFIKRYIKELPDDETTLQRRGGESKPLFSHILEDAASDPPYTERLDILQTLADGFPDIPEFRAHLGRYFMICRPENEIAAETHFATAYKKSMDMNQHLNEIPYTKRNEIRNICHMYGKMMSRKVFKYSGRFSYDKPLIQTNAAQFKTRALELLKSVLKACELFEKCREMTSPGYEECNGYMDEIHIRLAYCRFFEDNRDLHNPPLAEIDQDVAKFIEECGRPVTELFEELCDMSECPVNDKVMRLEEMYKKVMRSYDTNLRVPISPQDNPTTRRNEIVKIKHKYFDKRSSKYLEHLQDEGEIIRIVKLCEKNFDTCDEIDISLDFDFKEWIKAIRHPLYPGQDDAERVYRFVQRWYRLTQNCTNKSKQTVAMFYQFVLSCLLGFGSTQQPGNGDLLREALRLRHEVVFSARLTHNGDCRSEWLGNQGSFKQRLVEGNKWNTSTGEVSKKGLEIRVGTILHPNKGSHGYIDLFVGEANKESVRVYYVPAKWKTSGRSYVGKRVQLVVQFNMKHGLEAYNVKPVGRTKCATPDCGNNIETRSCDKEVTCGNCLHITVVQSV